MLVIIDAGHGGLIKGVYQTPGKRSPIWPDGRQLFEGVFNRSVTNKLHKLLEKAAIDSVILVPENEDISLAERTKRANKIYAERKDAFLISIHADAFSSESANGFTFFTSPGATKSDKISEIMFNEYKKAMPEIRQRVDTRDGDHDKEENFWMLRKSNCPAVLIECAFMTNKKECKMMLDEEDKFVDAIYQGIIAVRSSEEKN